MSQFSDLVADVYTLTNRSDLVAETALAVRQATLAAHRSDFYPRDVSEIPVTFAPPGASRYQIDISTFPQWRAFSYIRPFDVATNSAADFLLEFLRPDAIFDEYLIERVNVAYVAGSNLNINLQSAWDGFLVGYYVNPTLSPDAQYSSWIATVQPSIVVIDAAHRVLATIGYDEAAQRLRSMLYGPNGAPNNVTGGEYALFKANALEEQGR